MHSHFCLTEEGTEAQNVLEHPLPLPQCRPGLATQKPKSWLLYWTNRIWDTVQSYGRPCEDRDAGFSSCGQRCLQVVWVLGLRTRVGSRQGTGLTLVLL